MIILPTMRAGLSTFSPLSLSPALWLSDTGSDPSVWPDLSGNGRHAVQATGASQPAIVTGELNGRQVRRFDGGDWFETSVVPFDWCAAVTIFWITKAIGHCIQIESHNFNANAAFIVSSEPGGFNLAGLNTGYGYSIAQEYESTTGDFHVCSSVLNTDLETNEAVIYRDGIERTVSRPWWNTNSLGGFASNSVFIGCRDGAGYFMLGDMAEIIIYPYALDAFKRQSVERFLNLKWLLY